MKECNSRSNAVRCNCSWEPCPRKGVCCECITYHWKNREMPACFFPDAIEKTYDRTFATFVKTWKDKV